MEYLIQLYRQQLKQIFRENKTEATKVITYLQNGMITLDEAMEVLHNVHTEYLLNQDQQLEII